VPGVRRAPAGFRPGPWPRTTRYRSDHRPRLLHGRSLPDLRAPQLRPGEMAASSVAERLASPAAPWVHLWVGEDETRAARPAPAPGFVVRSLDGARCRTKRTLLDEMARVLAFPAYFGRSWDALEDCLTDLSWLPGAGYVLVVTRAERLLRRQPVEYRTLIDL